MIDKVDCLDTVPAHELKHIRRRAQVRYRCHLGNPARIRGGGLECVAEAYADNLSEGGIGLVMDVPPEPNTAVEIVIFSPHGGLLTLRARVAHVTSREGRTWMVGCELWRPLTPAEMDSLL